MPLPSLPAKAKNEYVSELKWIGVVVLVAGPAWFLYRGAYETAAAAALLGWGALAMHRKLQQPVSAPGPKGPMAEPK